MAFLSGIHLQKSTLIGDTVNSSASVDVVTVFCFSSQYNHHNLIIRVSNDCADIMNKRKEEEVGVKKQNSNKC